VVNTDHSSLTVKEDLAESAVSHDHSYSAGGVSKTVSTVSQEYSNVSSVLSVAENGNQEQNGTAAAGLSAGPSAADSSTADLDEDPAGDPEVEDLRNVKCAPRNQYYLPAAAWVLTTLFLLSVLKRTTTDNVICEVAGLLGTASQRKGKQNKPYSKNLMIFCLTLAGYSWKAYCYLRNTAKNCLPCRETLRKYRNKVDGSPGFSLSALRMVRNKVVEMAGDSKKLFLSVSCDDMSIRLGIYTIYTQESNQLHQRVLKTRAGHNKISKGGLANFFISPQIANLNILGIVPQSQIFNFF